MEYTLKDKLSLTKELLADLETKSWQEIDYLQSQIANIEINEETTELIQLLKNLLTSYYVFTGGLENLNVNAPKTSTVSIPVKQVEKPIPEDALDQPLDELPVNNTKDNDYIIGEIPTQNTVVEPFEYFVDFDEPIGDPWSDDDLYFNK